MTAGPLLHDLKRSPLCLAVQSFVERLKNFVTYWKFQWQDYTIVRPLIHGFL